MAEDINELCYIEEVRYIYYHNIGINLHYDDYFEIFKKARFATINTPHAETITSKISFIRQ